MKQALKKIKNNFYYHNKYIEEYGGNLLFLNELINTIQFTPNPKILDIGCGTGTLAQYLSFQAEIIGIEKSRKRSAIASQKIQCFYSRKGNIPQQIGPFDLIYCKEVLPSVRNKLKFFKSIRYNLKKSGTFCTYLPHKKDIVTKPLYRFTPSDTPSAISTYGSISNNVRLLKDAGFTHITKIRIPLGSVWLNENYVVKHWDGYFSNAEEQRVNKKRISGLNKMLMSINTLLNSGITVHYEFERTLLIAK